jgi:pimeloyl-ACP methyl ester carboxylesterase
MGMSFTKVANLPDRSVRYLEAGGGKTNVVLLHAFPLSAEQWAPQLSRVPRGLRLIAPDLRGFRGSGPAFDHLDLNGVTLDDYAADVLALMTHLDIERAVVAGVSMGGYVAFAMLRRASARVAGLVLANTRAIPDSAEAKSGRDRMIALLEREGTSAIAREMLPKLLGKTTRDEQPDLMDVVGHLIQMNSPAAIAAALIALKDRPDSTPLLSSISCPTTIVSGEEDAIIPAAETTSMQQAIRGATLITMPKVGHLSNLEAPSAFNDVLAGVATS